MKISPVKITEPYEDRRIRYAGLWENDGWNFKVYTITHKNNSEADSRTLDIAKDFAVKCVNSYNEIAEAYGLGYIILHKGMDSNFIAVNFWVGQNMLRTHTMMSSLGDEYGYKDTTATGMNACVWDAIVHNFERNAWVENILLKSSRPDTENYLSSIYSGEL